MEMIIHLVVSFLLGSFFAALIAGAAIQSSDFIVDRLKFLRNKTIILTILVLFVYTMSPPGFLRSIFMSSMTLAFYIIYKLDIDHLEAVRRDDLE